MADAASQFDAVIFDLFGTLVFVEADRLPRERVEGTETIVTIDDLAGLLARVEPRITKAEFLRTGYEVSVALQVEKTENNREVSSHLRFARVLETCGARGDVEAVAREMSERHMRALSSCVVCPDDRRALLAKLAERYRVALISNFDHAATAHAILARHGLDVLLEHVVISDDLGICKPSPAIFLDTCSRLEVEPARSVHVGDSMRADIEGATAAGLSAVWIDAGDGGERGPALATLTDVGELPAWLEA